ncbi:MAG: NPCBM/NEW2 domain-containing protein, partial [Gemmatimonadetes bacterium]|nr:NPCBM/NEW2 domain-containing protein [Gemmatimonadota bacterium]
MGSSTHRFARRSARHSTTGVAIAVASAVLGLACRAPAPPPPEAPPTASDPTTGGQGHRADALQSTSYGRQVGSGTRAARSRIRQSLLFLTEGAARGEPGPNVEIDQRIVNGELPVPLVLGGQRFRRGIAMAGSTRVTFSLPPGHDRLVATVGVSGFAGEGARLMFRVTGDTGELFRSPVMTGQTPPRRVVIPLAGTRSVTLSLADDSPEDTVPGAPPSRDGWGDWGDLALLEPGQEVPEPGSRPLQAWERTVAEMKASAYDLTFSLPSSAAGYRVLPWNYVDEMDPSRSPPAWPDTVRLSTFATPGEYEPLSFVLFAD